MKTIIIIQRRIVKNLMTAFMTGQRPREDLADNHPNIPPHCAVIILTDSTQNNPVFNIHTYNYSRNAAVTTIPSFTSDILHN